MSDERQKDPAEYVGRVFNHDGVTFEAIIVVPAEASYDDELELGEAVQRAASGMAVSYNRSRYPQVPF